MASRLAQYLAYVLLAFAGIAMMVNAPGFLVGYGLVYPAALYAVYAFKPAAAAGLFVAAHLLAMPVLLGSHAVFPIVAFASLALRPPVVYAVAWALGAGRLSRAGAAFALAALDQLVALSIATAYYGDDGIHVGLAIYEVLMAPYAYLAWQAPRRAGALGAVAATAAGASYYLGSYALPAPAAILGGVAAAAVLWAGAAARLPPRPAAAAALALAIIGAAVGGQALAYNASAALYPFKPSSWSEDRWAQREPGPGCPATVNVFEHTHSPERLRVLGWCVSVEGTVTGAPYISGDGDYSFDIVPGAEYSWMLGIGNIVLRKGALHIEVVPNDHFAVLGPIGGGVCPGDRVRVTGVFVVDTDHGMWTEVHPAYSIEVLEKASSEPWPDCLRGRVLRYGG